MKIEEKDFKDYITKEFEEVKDYIRVIKKSKKNRYGQWGLFIYGYPVTLSNGTQTCYSTYIGYEDGENNDILKYKIDIEKEEFKRLSYKGGN